MNFMNSSSEVLIEKATSCKKNAFPLDDELCRITPKSGLHVARSQYISLDMLISQTLL